MTDPIADLLTRIRNGYRAHKTEVVIPHSNLKYSIVKILEKNNFIGKVHVFDEDSKKFIKCALLPGLMPTLTRVSTPGQRIYVKSNEIEKVKSGMGIAVISTSKGVMTGYEANHQKLGGEHICNVY